MAKKFNVTYFKYDKNGDNEHIKSELGVGKKRLMTLLETSDVFIDVFNVEDHETGKVYLDDSEGKAILLDDLKHPGVNGIFKEGEV